ncbi:PHB depolymerase family esterase [Pararhodobacter sp. SW119]|uniref:extracellular catalytic domain type 1 short-chain-length polyhydroxyalkanoate depolymerase n=1 Tax=Pararhodobacter sp. SW119 TaxID=2780075 RepID=UPI001AE00E1D|nr:PHB depolymerase family esterase [Pararhodobacter sp. SW119]
MLNFKAGALRPATDGACPQRMQAANDLVRQTLSRHGLWVDQGGDGATLTDLMNGLNLPPTGLDLPRRPAPRIELPEGAEFRSATFTGHTGSRDYRHYVPASASDGVQGIVLMLHGCTQTPEDFAIGTQMNTLAEAHRLVVIYPEQARGANMQTCWNWFSKGDQRRDRGEPEILAGITRLAMAEHAVPADRVFVAGLSAGAAMAVILGETYPDLFAAVGAHSGLPFGAAHDVPTAFAAMGGDMQHLASVQPPAQARRTIVFHGDADRTVHPSNSSRIARRAGATMDTIETTETGVQSGRGYRRVITCDTGGTVLAEHWTVDGLGHAWSGGDGAGSYADPAGPDASAEMIRFFLDLTAEDLR